MMTVSCTATDTIRPQRKQSVSNRGKSFTASGMLNTAQCENRNEINALLWQWRHPLLWKS